MSHLPNHSLIPRSNRIPDLIRAAIAAIARVQLPDGSFQSYSSFSPDNFSESIPRHTIFFTANILICLGRVRACPDADHDYPEIIPVVARAVAFLLGEQNSFGSWNYWSRNAVAEGAPSYPDDLDDTFAALAGLWLYDRAIIDERMLAAMVKILTATEVEVGGPYRTWILPGDVAGVWRDVDVVINSTIGYFLALLGIRLPRLERFLGDAIEARNFSSPYYSGPIHVAYFLARFFGTHAIVPPKIIAPTTILEWALAVSAMVDLGFVNSFPPDAIAAFGAAARDADWPASAFCIDPARDGKICYAGASVLTAAFCAEALARYLAAAGGAGESRLLIKPPRNPFSPTLSIHARILTAARDACQKLSPELAATALAEIDTMQSEKITAPIYAFSKSLPRGEQQKISESTLDVLALANVYGWIAYTIYDDILDGAEAGERNGAHGSEKISVARRLPMAIFFTRQLADIYRELDATVAPGIWPVFLDTMTIIDAANAWEQANCGMIVADDDIINIDLAQLPDFGDYGVLADRSLGHALGPLAILLALGNARDSARYRATFTSFRHYLIARQLHDDAHDWTDDLRRGCVTSVGAMVLREFGADTSVATPAEISQLETFFWRETINRVVALILEEVAAARLAGASSSELLGVGGAPSFLEPELASLEASARRTLAERDRMLAFLAAYETTI